MIRIKGFGAAQTNEILITHPKNLFDDVKEDNNDCIKPFQLLSKILKCTWQIVIDASSQESIVPSTKSKKYSKLVFNCSLDDGTPSSSSSSNDDASICVSPQ